MQSERDGFGYMSSVGKIYNCYHVMQGTGQSVLQKEVWPSLAVNVFILEVSLTNYLQFSEQRVIQIVQLLQVCAPNMIIHLKIVLFLYDFTATLLTLLQYDST